LSYIKAALPSKSKKGAFHYAKTMPGQLLYAVQFLPDAAESSAGGGNEHLAFEYTK
jgi:hypothetical protein